MGGWIMFSLVFILMKTGFIKVIDELIERKFMFLEYDNIMDGFNMMIEKTEGFMKTLVTI